MSGVAEAGAVSQPSADIIRQTAHDVLQRSDYKLESEDLSWAGSLLDCLISLLRPCYHFFQGLYDISPVLAWGSVVVLTLILIALIWHIVYTFRSALRQRRQENNWQAAEGNQTDTANSWEIKASSAAQGLDFTLALRCLLRAGLLGLEEVRSRSPLRRGATNREYLRRFRGSAAQQPLAFLVDIVDLKWYGNLPCNAAEYAAAEQAYGQLRHATVELINAQRP